MKKNASNILSITLISLSIVSCTKNNIETPIINSNLSTIELSNNVELLKNPIEIEDHLKNESDLQDQYINEKLYHLGIKARNFFTDNTYNEHVISLAKQKNNYCISITDFINSLNAKQQNNKEFEIEELKTILNQTNLTYTNEGISTNYIPSIHVFNANKADHMKNPIIALPVEINSELPEFESYENYIIGWYANENGNFSEVLIGEEQALNTSHPIYIIDNADNVSSIANTNSKNTSNNVDFKENTMPTTQYLKHIIDQYKINYRYDNSSRSEYSYNLVYSTNGTGALTEGGHRTEIREIHKNDIGNYFYTDFEIWQVQFMNNLGGTYFVSFEYDWYATKKTVTWNSSVSKTISRMKYGHEYYQKFYIPCDKTAVTSWSKGYIHIKKQY